MAIEGFALQSGSYNAEIWRRATMGLLLERGSSIGSVVGGLKAATDLQTVAGTGMNVETSPGEIVVDQEYSASGGPNYIRNTSTATSKVPAASPTLPRIDLIVTQVLDSAYHGSTNEYALSYLEGTATSGAALGNKNGEPTIPTSSIKLSRVLVPANATSLTNADIENVAKPAASGLQIPNGSVGTSQLAALAVTAAKLGEEAVTDAKIVKGRALVETENSYGLQEVRATATEFEPSATRFTFVTLEATTGSVNEPAGITQLTVGGILIGSAFVPKVTAETSRAFMSFLCPPAKKWKVQSAAGTLRSNYLTL